MRALGNKLDEELGTLIGDRNTPGGRLYWEHVGEVMKRRSNRRLHKYVIASLRARETHFRGPEKNRHSHWELRQVPPAPLRPSNMMNHYPVSRDVTVLVQAGRREEQTSVSPQHRTKPRTPPVRYANTIGRLQS